MGFHQTVVQGALSADAEKKLTPGGTSYLKFTIPVNESWKNAAGEKQEKTTWYRCTIWGKLADSLAPHLKKGKAVMVIGTVEANAFMGNDGEPRANLDLKVSSFNFVSGNSGSGGGERSSEYDDYTPPPADLDDIPF